MERSHQICNDGDPKIPFNVKLSYRFFEDMDGLQHASCRICRIKLYRADEAVLRRHLNEHPCKNETKKKRNVTTPLNAPNDISDETLHDRLPNGDDNNMGEFSIEKANL